MNFCNSLRRETSQLNFSHLLHREAFNVRVARFSSFSFFFASHLSAATCCCCGLPALLAAKVPETVNRNRSYQGKRNEAEVSLWIHEARRNIWEQRGQDDSLFKKEKQTVGLNFAMISNWAHVQKDDAALFIIQLNSTQRRQIHGGSMKTLLIHVIKLQMNHSTL